VGEKARVVAPWGYKFWYSGRDKNRNGVGIIIDYKFINDVVEVHRKNDKILSIKIMISNKITAVINAYTPQWDLII
jgi:exonuclease III